ncbi:MAG: hypothetical protein ABIW84_00770 [Ilumatobacteraceae bacterium]
MSDVMRCGTARRIGWPDSSPRILDDDGAAAAQHIAECAACRAFVEDMREISSRLSASSEGAMAPREVRERIFGMLSRTRSGISGAAPRSNPVRQYAIISAAAVLMIAGSVWRVTSARPRETAIVSLLADDHRRAFQANGIASEDVPVVSQWLSDRVGFAVHAPTFTNGHLVGARLADVNGQRAAVLVYRVDDQPVSYYILPAGDDAKAEQVNGEPTIRLFQWRGFHVAAWEEPGLTEALVGDLPQARLAVLARECITQMVAVVPTRSPTPAGRG